MLLERLNFEKMRRSKPSFVSRHQCK